MPDESRLEEQILSQAAEIGISTQLDEVEKIEVDVQSDLLKMAQGKADAVTVTGQGLVVQKDIRLQKVEVHTSKIDIDWLSALFGEVALHQPTDATVRVLLREEDINRALNSDYIHSQMSSIQLDVDDEPVTIQAQQLKLHLPDGNRMVFSGNLLLHQKGGTQQIGFTGSVRSRTDDQPVLLEAFHCTQGEGISLQLAAAFIQKASELVNSPNFDFQGTAFRVIRMDVQRGSLALEVEAQIGQFPSL